MRMLALIFAALVAIVCNGGDALAAKRVALVIGNSAYRNVAPLTNPANDAAAIAAMFRQAQFDAVALHDNLSNIEMRRALREFSDQARGADIAVVYFAGHGIEIDGVNYLIPVDATIERDTDAYDEAIALDRILQAVEPAKQLRLVILDACRDNPFAKKMRRMLAVRSIGRGLAGVEPNQPNTLIAYAAKGGSTASDGGGKNSPFASALVKHLTTPGLGVRRAFGYVRDDVLAATGNRQEPFVYGSLGGDEVTLVPAAPAAAVAVHDVRGDYELAEKVGTVEAWDSFIKTHPAGFYTDLAKAQRNKLRNDMPSRADAAVTPPKSGAATPAAQSKPQAESPQQAVAALPSTEDASSRIARAPNSDIPRLLQVELARVGCAAGEPDGVWGTASQRALASFNRHARTQLDTSLPNVAALDAVRGQRGRVCPLTCERGSHAVGGKCVASACRRGYERDDDGVCRAVGRSERATRSREPRARRDAVPSATPHAAQVICNDHGCRPVSRGCRAAVATGPFQSEVCN